MAMDGGSCQGARREAGRPHRDQRDGVEVLGAGLAAGARRRLRDARPGRPEHELAQVVGAPEAAVAGGRDGRDGHADEHHGERRA
jgi:hypothetical protein